MDHAVIDLTSSLLLGAIGALLTFIIGVTVRAYRQRRLRRSYPIAGDFVTEYDDIEGNDIVRRKAMSSLLQKGRTVTGTTTELDTGRSWQLQGTLNPGGFIFGFYHADDPHDRGSGTFFLEIDGHTGDLHGLWSGYDSVNRKVSSGRYLFFRCPDVMIREVRPHHASRVVALLGEALGERYIEIDDIMNSISDPDRVCFVAIVGSEIAGAATASVFSTDELPAQFPVDKREHVQALSMLRYHARIGHLEAVAVSPRFRGRGIATMLVDARLKWFATKTATGVMSFGWQSADGCHIRGVLESFDFREHGVVPDFWTESSKLNHYMCPACGSDCHCSAVIYARATVAENTGIGRMPLLPRHARGSGHTTGASKRTGTAPLANGIQGRGNSETL